MTINKWLTAMLFSAGLVGCGGGSQDLGMSTAPQPLQRTMSGGAPPAVQADVPAGLVVSIAGYRDSYTIVKSEATQAVAIVGKTDGSVTTYHDPRLIKFFDKWISFDIDGPAGQVYRLYQAAFNRKPDLPGLGFWLKANENGRAVIDIAGDFVGSAEFKALYGQSPAGLQLVNAFYNNVLHRDGEKAGVDWWVGKLNNGVPVPGVLYGFSDSAENKSSLAADMRSGFDYEPYQPAGPIIPKRYSYANAKGLNIASQRIPSFPGTEAYGEGATGGVAFGDFLQTGQLSLVVFTNRWSKVSATPSPAGAIHFYQYVNGEPVEVTEKLLKDTSGCVAPRRLIVADFNNDGKPDVFASCHGSEFGPYDTWPGEHPRFLMSQRDGTYANVEAPVTCYCHAASAGDINGDGAVDLLVSDGLSSRDFHSGFIALLGDGKGGFTVVRNDTAEFINGSADHEDHDRRYYKQYLTLELLDIDGDGRLDMFLGAGEKDTNSRILKGSGDGKFLTQLKIFPRATEDVQVIDAVFVNNTLYEYLMLNVQAGQGTKVYARKYAADMDSYSTIFTKAISNGGADLIFIMPFNNTLVPYDEKYNAPIDM
jgi:hypothetical protein